MENALPVINRTVEESVKNEGLPIWGIVIIVLLGVLIGLLITVMTIFLLKRKHEKNKEIPKEEIHERKKIEIEIEPRKVTDVIHKETHSNYTQKLWSTKNDDREERKDGEENAQIIIRDISVPERVYKVAAVSGVVLGRTQGDILFPDDKFISSKHAIITYETGIMFVRDVGSANGTFYMNKKIDGKTAIVNGGIVKVGNTQLKVEYRKE